MGVPSHQGARESRTQGEVAQVVGCPGAVRYARCGTPKQEWALFERCSEEATGELLEIERLTSSLERGHWKSTREGNSLVAYSTASTVRGGGHAMPSGLTVPTLLKDRVRLWKAGIRDLVMELCCALHNFRVRLNPWLPMI